MFITTHSGDLINPKHIVQVLTKGVVKCAINDSFYLIFSNYFKVDNFDGDKDAKYCLCIMIDGSQHVCLLDNVLSSVYFELPELANSVL